MHSYEIYLIGNQTISGEIEDPEPLRDLMHVESNVKTVTIKDTEGTMIIKPVHVLAVSYWEEKTKEKSGFR